MLTFADMTEKSRSAIELAADAVGGVPTLAELLGVTRHAIYQWERVPAGRVIPIEAATGGKVTRHDLRPDLYPVEAKRTGKAA